MNPILSTTSKSQPLLRLDLNPEAATSASELFKEAAQSFLANVETPIDFHPDYQLQEDECFQIRDFPLDEDLLAACRQPISLNRVNANQLGNLNIKSVIGYHSEDEKQHVYFQSFDVRKVLIPGNRWAFFAAEDQSTFQELKSPIIFLEPQLTAIWEDGTLLFKSFHLAKRIFDLSDYFTEATNEQVAQFASHARFADSDLAVLQATCTPWYRRKIALILRGGDLDRNSIEDLLNAATTLGYELPMSGNKIQLPNEKREFKRLIQFLAEDMYLGLLSQRKFISSGKRIADSE